METKRRCPKEEEERRRSQRKLGLIAALYNPMVSHDIEKEQKKYNQGPYDNVTFTEEELKKLSMTEASKEELKEIIRDTYVIFEFTAEGYILAFDQRKQEMIANLEKFSSAFIVDSLYWSKNIVANYLSEIKDISNNVAERAQDETDNIFDNLQNTDNVQQNIEDIDKENLKNDDANQIFEENKSEDEKDQNKN